jgi:iron complex transport system permease protein
VKNKIKKRIWLIIAFVVLVLVSFRVGVLDFTYKDFLSGDSDAIYVFWISRLPRTLSIILAASAMSIAGLIMQAISRNKFVSPTTAGTTNAAILGVLLGYVFMGSQSLYMKTAFALVFAMLSSVIFMMVLQKIQFKNVVYIPLVGMMYGAMISAIATFIAHQFDALQFLNTIGVGGFANKAIGTYELLYLVIPAIVVAIIYATRFSIVGMGQDFAKNLGVNYNLVMYIGLFAISLITSVTFVMVGMLPFIGLIVPNLMTKFYGDHVKKTLFDVALFGSAFVLLNDIIGRLIVYPYEVSITFTMGVTGAIIFLSMILVSMKHEK